MKEWIAAVAVTATLATSVQAQSKRIVRQVQLIAMGGVSDAAGPAARSEAGVPAGISSPPEIPGFAVHDLSRRYVEYRMANELRGDVESALMAEVRGLRASIQLLPSNVEAQFHDPDTPAVE